MDEAVGNETHFSESIGEKEQVGEVSCLNNFGNFDQVSIKRQ